jgi:hypothetical protein
MMIAGKILAGLVGPENPIGLMGRVLGGDGNGPESIIHATACDDDMVVLDDLDIVLREESGTVVITELGKGDKCASLEFV